MEIQKRLVSMAALVLAACAQQPTAPTSATASSSLRGQGEGALQIQAVGDVKNGPIDIDLVRVAQTDGVPAFYANPGGEYVVRPNLPVEIYIQIWTSNPPVLNPRLIVDWGTGERDNIGCGSCRLSYTYRIEGRYKVTVIMDDRISGVTTRSFTLNVSSPAASPTPVPTPTSTATPTPTPTATPTPSPTPTPACSPGYLDMGGGVCVHICVASNPCLAPPPSVCSSSSSLTVFLAPGVCTLAPTNPFYSCSYIPTTIPCATACVGGVCS